MDTHFINVEYDVLGRRDTTPAALVGQPYPNRNATDQEMPGSERAVAQALENFVPRNSTANNNETVADAAPPQAAVPSSGWFSWIFGSVAAPASTNETVADVASQPEDTSYQTTVAPSVLENVTADGNETVVNTTPHAAAASSRGWLSWINLFGGSSTTTDPDPTNESDVASDDPVLQFVQPPEATTVFGNSDVTFNPPVNVDVTPSSEVIPAVQAPEAPTVRENPDANSNPLITVDETPQPIDTLTDQASEDPMVFGNSAANVISQPAAYPRLGLVRRILIPVVSVPAALGVVAYGAVASGAATLLDGTYNWVVAPVGSVSSYLTTSVINGVVATTTGTYNRVLFPFGSTVVFGTSAVIGGAYNRVLVPAGSAISSTTSVTYNGAVVTVAATGRGAAYMTWPVISLLSYATVPAINGVGAVGRLLHFNGASEEINFGGNVYSSEAALVTAILRGDNDEVILQQGFELLKQAYQTNMVEVVAAIESCLIDKESQRQQQDDQIPSIMSYHELTRFVETGNFESLFNLVVQHSAQDIVQANLAGGHVFNSFDLNLADVRQGDIFGVVFENIEDGEGNRDAYLNIMKFLLAHGARPNIDTMINIIRGNLTVVDPYLTLLNRNYPVSQLEGINEHTVDGDGATLLIEAIISGRLAVVDYLILAGADANTEHRRTPLMYAVESGNIPIVARLIEAGANIHAVDGNGNTALIHAAINGHLEVIKALVKAGAKIDATNNDNEIAQGLARKNKHGHIVDYLKQQRINKRMDSCNIL